MATPRPSSRRKHARSWTTRISRALKRLPPWVNPTNVSLAVGGVAALSLVAYAIARATRCPSPALPEPQDAAEGPLVPYAGDPRDGNQHTSRRSDGTERVTQTVTPVGPRFEPRHFPSLSGWAWARYIYRILVTENILPPGPAALFIAHVYRETGGGRSGWNNNMGNIRAWERTTGPWHRLSDGLPYRAYRSTAEGLRAIVDLLRTNDRYAEAWAQLLACDTNWYGTMGVAGYYECHGGACNWWTVRDAQAEYDRILERSVLPALGLS